MFCVTRLVPTIVGHQSGGSEPSTRHRATMVVVSGMVLLPRISGVRHPAHRPCHARRPQFGYRPILKLTLVFPCSSSSTPTVPYSTADILYGNEVNGRASLADEAKQNSFGELERRSKTKDLDQTGNRRPGSRNGKNKGISIDTGEPWIWVSVKCTSFQ